jgi:hypothetical protein
MACTGEPIVKSRAFLISIIVTLAAFAATAVSAADADRKYTREQFKTDVKAVGTGIKDAAVAVGHQVGTATRNAFNGTKTKVKKDAKDGNPGDGSLAKKNDRLPAVTEGRKTN